MTADSSGPEAPLCAAPDPNPRRPKYKLPRGATDTHAHICGPAARYPYFAERVYTPPDCLLSAYQHMLATLGLERAVLVQPSVYGTDNRAMLDALTIAGPNFRGVAVVDESIDDDELDRLHEAGVRGVRCNVVDVQPQDKGRLPLDQLTRLARKIRRLNWHIELLVHVDEFPEIDRNFADFPVDIVVGHLGYMRTEKGLDAPGFRGLTRLMRDGRCWAKLTGPYRISSTAMPHADVIPFAHALIDAAKERVIWGSDWPHVMVRGAMPNDGQLCDLLLDWVPDEKTREQVLSNNPARLYGF
jgi:2-pyrone-4,6-dicarboxylate lactonase